MYQKLIEGAYKQIDIFLSEFEMVDTEFDLKGNETFDELLRLNSQFQNLSYLSQYYNLVTDELKSKLYSDMVELYRKETFIANQELILAFETVSESYKSALGIDFKLTKIKSDTSKKIVRGIIGVKRICIRLYLSFVFAFLIALGYLLLHLK